MYSTNIVNCEGYIKKWFFTLEFSHIQFTSPTLKMFISQGIFFPVTWIKICKELCKQKNWENTNCYPRHETIQRKEC